MHIPLEQAAALLRNGDVVGVPTETVYGLAAAISQPAAIDRIFALKNRPADNPLIIHVAAIDQIAEFIAGFPAAFDALATEFWPGPLTLVIPILEDSVPNQVRAGLSTAAFRVPGHPLTRELLTMTGPLVMPSANISGRPSATTPVHVEADFGKDFPVLDGGACGKGVESTILIFQGDRWTVGRLGAIPAERFAAVLGYVPAEAKKGEVPLCPGQRYRHYAPKAKLHFGHVEGCDTVLGYREREYVDADRVIILGSISDPEAVAERLYAALRRLDDEGVVAAWVDVDVPREGLWLTILDRLYKASGK
jgi:L-threonylcarbamoyladenylate synthase